MITAASMGFGEIIKDAGLNTILGMCVVLFMLVLICLLIFLLRYLNKGIDWWDMHVWEALRRNKKYAPAPAQNPAPVQATPAPAPVKKAPAAAAAPQAVNPQLDLVAVITAAIAASEDVPADGIIIRSIRRSGKNNWKKV